VALLLYLEQDKNPLSRVLQLILLIFHSIQKAAKASGLVALFLYPSLSTWKITVEIFNQPKVEKAVKFTFKTKLI
jgi:ABC-type phosphate transport system ATPase subunit